MHWQLTHAHAHMIRYTLEARLGSEEAGQQLREYVHSRYPAALVAQQGPRQLSFQIPQQVTQQPLAVAWLTPACLRHAHDRAWAAWQSSIMMRSTTISIQQQPPRMSALCGQPPYAAAVDCRL